MSDERPPLNQRARLVPRWLLIVVTVMVGLFLAQELIPVPYVIERPGPVANTLGDVRLGDETVPMIQIEGAPSYPADGVLNLLTVSIVGSPEDNVNWFELLAAAIDPTQEIVPMELIFPSGQTTDERTAENQAQMISSQDAATAAALGALDIPYEQTLSVANVSEQGPAFGVLEAGDVLLAVNGTPVESYSSLRASIEANGAGKAATFTVLRNGEQQDVRITPVSVEQQDGSSAVLIGVSVKTTFEFPFQVSIQVDQIGGPSAGLMFALGITDLLTTENLAKGLTVSGTGTIDASGTVGAIGGLPQKITAARRADSDLIFIPADQCSEVPKAEFDRVRIVPVATLSEAVGALTTLQGGASPSALPSCAFGSSQESAQ